MGSFGARVGREFESLKGGGGGGIFTASVGIITISLCRHKALCKNFPTTFCSENAICFSAAYLTRFHNGRKFNTIYTGFIWLQTREQTTKFVTGGKRITV